MRWWRVKLQARKKTRWILYTNGLVNTCKSNKLGGASPSSSSSICTKRSEQWTAATAS